MKVSQITILLIIAAYSIQTAAKQDDNDKAANPTCNTNEFLAYTNPGNRSDLTTTCKVCQCGQYGVCQDYIGCQLCSPRLFKQYNDANYQSRTYSYCTSCSDNCYSYACQDYVGCTKCYSNYHTQRNNTQNSGYYYSCERSMDYGVFFSALSVLVIIIVVVVVLTVRNAKKKRIIAQAKINYQNGYQQQPNQIYQPTPNFQQAPVQNQQYNQGQYGYQPQNYAANTGNQQTPFD